jgi:hypothetical protein
MKKKIHSVTVAAVSGTASKTLRLTERENVFASPLSICGH